MLSPFAGGPSLLCAFGLGCEALCWGLCLWGQAGSQTRGSEGPRGASEHKAVFVGPPQARRLGTHSGAVCAWLFGFPARDNVIFSSRDGQAEGLGVRGQAGTSRHTAPLCSVGLNEMLFPRQG